MYLKQRDFNSPHYCLTCLFKYAQQRDTQYFYVPKARDDLKTLAVGFKRLLIVLLSQ